VRVTAGSYVKDVRRVAWYEGSFPSATLVVEPEWGSGVIDCPDHATLQTLSEGTLIRHDGQYAIVIEYSFDDANYPLKSNPNGDNTVWLLTDEEIEIIRKVGRLTLRFKQSEIPAGRMASLTRLAEGAEV